jgi:hypothetical protein
MSPVRVLSLLLLLFLSSFPSPPLPSHPSNFLVSVAPNVVEILLYDTPHSPAGFVTTSFNFEACTVAVVPIPNLEDENATFLAGYPSVLLSWSPGNSNPFGFNPPPISNTLLDGAPVSSQNYIYSTGTDDIFLVYENFIQPKTWSWPPM